MKRINHKNINQPELTEKFWEHRWNGELNYIDFERFKELVKYFEGGNYLDVGCFNSPMPMELKKEFPDAEVHALDHAPKVIQALKERYPDVHYVVGDCYELPYEDDSMDYVVAGEILEHLEDPQAFVDEMYRVIKKGGWLAISTPFEETVSQPCFGGEEHLWTFDAADMETLFEKFQGVEVNVTKDNYNILMVYGQK